MVDASSIMIALIKSVLRGKSERESWAELESAEACEKLYTISNSHDLAHFVGYAINKLGIKVPEAYKNKFLQEQMVAVYRYEGQNYELGRACDALEKAGVKHVPLKGSVIRAFYPEPWLRTSCDIDILVDEKDLPVAINAITEACSGRVEDTTVYHDVSIFTDSNVHIELHFRLHGYQEAHNEMFEKTWENALPVKGFTFKHEFTDEFLFAHIVEHMASHFFSGGSGVKPFMDLWVLRQNLHIDQTKLDALLDMSTLTKFYQSVVSLSEAWFGDGKHDELTAELANFILKGGVYGTLEQKVAVSQFQNGGKFCNLMRRIFFPYKMMILRYPSLKKCPPLYPVYIVIRWFAVLFGKYRKQAFKEFKEIFGGSVEQQERVAKLIKTLEL